jgi:hypothetical protein
MLSAMLKPVPSGAELKISRAPFSTLVSEGKELQ